MATQLVPQSDKMKTIAGMLQDPKMKEQIAAALPKNIRPERFIRLVITELRRVPALQECTPISLLGAVMEFGQLGLEIGSKLGQAYLIPYGTECTAIVGYRGMVQLAWRSSMVRSIAVRAVFEDDDFRFNYGTDEIHHVSSDERDPAKLTHVYCIVHTTNGGRLFDVMTRKEVDRIRARSRAGTKGPWVTDYVEMAKKTVLRRTWKMMPASSEMQRAMALDDAADLGEAQDFDLPIDIESEVVETKAKGASADAAAKALDTINNARKAQSVNPTPHPDSRSFDDIMDAAKATLVRLTLPEDRKAAMISAFGTEKWDDIGKWGIVELRAAVGGDRVRKIVEEIAARPKTEEKAS